MPEFLSLLTCIDVALGDDSPIFQAKDELQAVDMHGWICMVGR
jgi:hypothetical protein